MEGTAPGQELVEHAAHGEEVAAPIHLRALHLLRRHVVGRAHDVAGAGHGGGGQAGHPEVHDLHRAVLVDEDVRGLDVAVHDAGLVRMGEAGQHLHDDVDLALQGQGRGRAHRLLQVHALEQLHRDERRAVGVRPEVEDVHHVGMRHARDGLGLALEPRLELGVVGDGGHHHLERDVALEDGVVGEVHDPHRALAQRLDDVVFADAARKLLDRRRRRGRIGFGVAHRAGDNSSEALELEDKRTPESTRAEGRRGRPHAATRATGEAPGRDGGPGAASALVIVTAAPWK